MKTDSRLQEEVIAELAWDPSVHAARIGVEVKDGIVTLDGQVDSYAEKWRAERTAQRVSGVQPLVTSLQVQIPGLSQRTDGDIAAAAQNALDWTHTLPAGPLAVVVEGGWVTLSGDVNWQFQKQAAADGVRALKGVVGIRNRINITPSVTAGAVKTEVEAALKRSSITDAGTISVSVSGPEVTLGGTVQSWADRETAANSAWGMPGVLNVVDAMRLAS